MFTLIQFILPHFINSKKSMFLGTFIIFLVSSAYQFNISTLPNPTAFKLSHYTILNIENQSFRLGLDFSSINTFVFSTNCSCTSGSSFLQGIPADLELLTIFQPNSKEINYKNFVLSGFENIYSIQDTSPSLSYNFFVVEKAPDFPLDFQLDGILGLGHGTNETDDTFTESILTDTHKVSFAIVLNSYYNTSFSPLIEFGQDDIKDFFQGKQRKKELKENSNEWKLYTNRIQLNDYWTEFEAFGRFDINSKEILVPESYYGNVTKTLNDSFNNLSENLDFPCEESEIDSFKSVIFKIQSTKFPVRPRNYIEYRNGKCCLLVKKTSGSTWVFGEPFFKDYFIRFNYADNDITFYQLDKFMPGFYEISIAVFIILVFITSICGGWCLTSRNFRYSKQDMLLDKRTS